MNRHAHSGQSLPDQLFDAVFRLHKGLHRFGLQVRWPRQPPPAERFLQLATEFRPCSVDLVARSSVLNGIECCACLALQTVQKCRLLRFHICRSQGTDGAFIVLCQAGAREQDQARK